MRPPDKARRGPRRENNEKDQGPLRIWGLHAVDAALANEQRGILRLHLTDNAERRLSERLAARGAEVTRTSPRDLERILGAEAVHQGALAEVEPLHEPELADLIATAETTTRPLVVLDQVTDPHNVGAILRSAAVLGTRASS